MLLLATRGAAETRRPTLEASAELGTYVDNNAVSVVTPTARVGARAADDSWRAGARYLVDVVSAASPDIVATASPRWSEVRHVLSADGSYGGKRGRIGGSAAASIEPDYLSLSAGLTPSVQLDREHITIAAGYVLGRDTIGRRDTSFDTFSRTLWRHAATLGASFVLNASTLLWLGVDTVLERGNQAKPYRYIPMFSADGASRVGAGAAANEVDRERLPERPLERLPERRDRFAVTSRLLRRFDHATLRLEQRLYADTWEQRASTSDARWLHDLDARLALGPSARFHVQNATSFWQRTYVPETVGDDLRLPEYRTGDRELGALWTLTLGADARVALTPAHAERRATLVLRLAGSHTQFLDTLFVTTRQALLCAVGFEGQL